MTDKREAILERLLAIATGIDGIAFAARNELDVPESKRPAIVIWDADETAEDRDPASRPANAPRLVGMTPECWILLPGFADTVGSELNTLRARWIKAVTGDATLLALIHDRRGIRYESSATGLSRGRQIEASMGILFTFTYVLKPDAL